MTTTIEKSSPTLEQRRAKHAWESVQGVKKLDKSKAKEYAGAAKKLPMRIMAAGLGSSLAFILAKAKDKKFSLHEHLTDWVLVKRPLKGEVPTDLLQSIIKGDSLFLRRATDETLSYLQWLNRFAEAEGLTEGE